MPNSSFLLVIIWTFFQSKVGLIQIMLCPKFTSFEKKNYLVCQFRIKRDPPEQDLRRPSPSPLTAALGSCKSRHSHTLFPNLCNMYWNRWWKPQLHGCSTFITIFMCFSWKTSRKVLKNMVSIWNLFFPMYIYKNQHCRVIFSVYFYKRPKTQEI